MRKTIIVAGVAMIIGALAGYLGSSMLSEIPSQETSADGNEEALYWVAPMDPNFRRDKPGKSPMGMDLIPVYESDQQAEDNALRIDPSVVNNIGVRIETATVSDLFREINTVGFVAVDETKTAHVHVRTAGWVDKLHRKAVGEMVRAGELIFELYSPELVSAQSEYLQAVRLNNTGLMRAAAERLVVLGMSRDEISTLKSDGKVKERVGVRAPQDGVIMALSIGEGMHVTPDKTVFSLADLSTIWVQAEVFESQSAWVKAGQVASMTLPFLPGESWEGTVDYVYPVVDVKSRTVQVRLKFLNTDGRLKPNMYGEINLDALPIENAVSVSREALIRTGKSDRVILSLGEGRFRPAEVLAGLEARGRVEIKAGLAEGEQVVTSGQFLIDSEASLTGAFLRLLKGGEEIAGAANMTRDSDADQMAENSESDVPEVHHGMGTLLAFNEDGGVTLEHEPIASLNWPGMTMDFAVASIVDLSIFSEGDRIHFMIQQTAEGPYIITTASKM